jgi:hypothetical protein
VRLIEESEEQNQKPGGQIPLPSPLEALFGKSIVRRIERTFKNLLRPSFGQQGESFSADTLGNNET